MDYQRAESKGENMVNVEFDGVHKQFDDGFTAVQNLSLEIKDKEFLVLLGPSGCGKSTTLRMLAGLEDVTDGKIMIDGMTVNHLPAGARGLGMVFQSYALYPHMTIRDNLSFGLRMMKGSDKLDDEEIQSRVNEIADLLDLGQHLQKKPKELSGGQRQRVALGRALVRRPKVLLMDEPLSNLDAELRHQMRNEIRRLHDELGTTTIYVTHDQIEAMTLADRIAILNNGELQQHCAPLEAYHNPANDFVRSFLCKHIDDLVQTANSLFNNPSTSSEDSE
jgi:multiple sugar transport system ATP-binding protein